MNGSRPLSSPPPNWPSMRRRCRCSGKTKTGYFWAIARDDRPWGGTDPPAVAYTYAPGRGGEHLEKLLANYRGIVQCDGYAPYKKLPAERITVAFCWSDRKQYRILR